jgi:hypothetical protein
MGPLSPSSQSGPGQPAEPPTALEEDRSIQGTSRPSTMRFLLSRVIARHEEQCEELRPSMA